MAFDVRSECAMPNQHLAALLQAQWNLLWPLNPQRRREVIAEVAADYSFEEQMKAVAFEMAEAA